MNQETRAAVLAALLAVAVIAAYPGVQLHVDSLEPHGSQDEHATILDHDHVPERHEAITPSNDIKIRLTGVAMTASSGALASRMAVSL